jgi:hypothetical protein
MNINWRVMVFLFKDLSSVSFEGSSSVIQCPLQRRSEWLHLESFQGISYLSTKSDSDQRVYFVGFVLFNS